MNLNKFSFLLFSAILISSFTGCYTQVATNEPYQTAGYNDDLNSTDYYSQVEGEFDSSYFAESDTIQSDGQTEINNYYYGYPSHSYYSSALSFGVGFGIGFGWGWGWWGYYPYYTYWPYYYYSWYYPYYYYPDYYYCYSPYYYNDYYCGYPSDYYGYKTRNNYISGIRNNSGGRNSGQIIRDPITSNTGGISERILNDKNSGRDLTVNTTKVSDRNTLSVDKNRDFTGQVISSNDIVKNVDKTRNDISVTKNSGLISNTNTRLSDQKIVSTKDNNKKLGLDREISKNKQLGNTQSNDVIGKLFDKNSKTDKNSNTYIRTKNNNTQLTGKNNKTVQTKGNQINRNKTSNYTPTKRNNTTQTKTYSPPKQNTNTTKTYTPTRTNTNTTRSYSPPRTNNTTRSYSPPTRTGSFNNSSGKRR